MPQFKYERRDALIVSAVECKECEMIVFSRAEQDVRSCTCGRVVVMGGQKHFKYDVYTNPPYEVKKVEIQASMSDLFQDWEEMRDEYGLMTANQQ